LSQKETAEAYFRSAVDFAGVEKNKHWGSSPTHTFRSGKVQLLAKKKACISLQVLTEFYSAVTKAKNEIPLSPEKAKKERKNHKKDD